MKSVRLTSWHRRPSRSAWTLVELVIAGALLSLLMGMVVSLLAALIHSRQSSNQRALERADAHRLTTVLRSDLREAILISQPRADVLAVILPTGQNVRYTLAGSQCIREASAMADAAGTSDRYRVGPASEWEIVRPAEGAGDTTTVSIVRPDVLETEMPPLPIRVVAIGQNTSPAP